MKQLFFLFAIIVFACLSIYRPVYETTSFYNSFNDFENSIGWCKDNNCHTIVDEKPFSGDFSCKMDTFNRYSYIYQIDVGQLPENKISKIGIEARVFSAENPKDLFVICQFQHGNDIIYIWLPKQVTNEKNKWVLFSENFGFDKIFDRTDKVAIYFWRRTGDEIVYVDDMNIKFY